MTKRLSYWQEEACTSKHAYICEFDAVQVNRKASLSESKPAVTSTHTNRLIRVACGSSATLFADSTVTQKIVASSAKPRANSIKNIQKPARKTNLFLPYSPVNGNDLVIIAPKEAQPLADTLKQNLTTPTHLVASSAGRASFWAGSDLALLIAIVCGASVVLVLVNIFCIWNYYSKKLKNIRKKELEQDYRTSTLIRGKLHRHQQHADLGNANRLISNLENAFAFLHWLCLLNALINHNSTEISKPTFINFNCRALLCLGITFL